MGETSLERRYSKALNEISAVFWGCDHDNALTPREAAVMMQDIAEAALALEEDCLRCAGTRKDGDGWTCEDCASVYALDGEEHE